jgi:hypothetical protein
VGTPEHKHRIAQNAISWILQAGAIVNKDHILWELDRTMEVAFAKGLFTTKIGRSPIISLARLENLKFQL